MLAAILAIGLGMAIIGLALTLSARALARQDDPVAGQIEALLPQTQCAQCTYPGCRPYAEAIAAGAADINRCPPGGQDTIDALARLLGRESKPLSVQVEAATPVTVAIIHEDLCIGCKLCIKACPVDAILGTAKRMHTVIESECTGCALCVAPCPVDCIDMVAPGTSIARWRRPAPVMAQPS